MVAGAQLCHSPEGSGEAGSLCYGCPAAVCARLRLSVTCLSLQGVSAPHSRHPSSLGGVRAHRDCLKRDGAHAVRGGGGDGGTTLAVRAPPQHQPRGQRLLQLPRSGRAQAAARGLSKPRPGDRPTAGMPPHPGPLLLALTVRCGHWQRLPRLYTASILLLTLAGKAGDVLAPTLLTPHPLLLLALNANDLHLALTSAHTQLLGWVCPHSRPHPLRDSRLLRTACGRVWSAGGGGDGASAGRGPDLFPVSRHNTCRVPFATTRASVAKDSSRRAAAGPRGDRLGWWYRDSALARPPPFPLLPPSQTVPPPTDRDCPNRRRGFGAATLPPRPSSSRRKLSSAAHPTPPCSSSQAWPCAS